MVSTSMCFLTRMRCAAWSWQHLRTDNFSQYVQRLVQTKSILPACLKSSAQAIINHGNDAADGCLDVRQRTCSSSSSSRLHAAAWAKRAHLEQSSPGPSLRALTGGYRKRKRKSPLQPQCMHARCRTRCVHGKNECTAAPRGRLGNASPQAAAMPLLYCSDASAVARQICTDVSEN